MMVAQIAFVVAVSIGATQADAPPDGGTAEVDDQTPLAAFEFYGFRVLVNTDDEEELDAITYDALLAMDEATRPKGHFFDGMIWGRSHNEGATSYAGQTHDRIRWPDDGFVFFDRANPHESIVFPRSATVFGRNEQFAWRGDAIRNIFFLFADDPSDPGFEAEMVKFDLLFGLSAEPENFFRDRWGNPAKGLSIERSETRGEDGSREVVLRAFGNEEVEQAYLVVRFQSDATTQPASWSLCQFIGDKLTFRWDIVLREHSLEELSLPAKPEDLIVVHSWVEGMDDPPLAHLSGKLIGAGEMSDPEVAAANSQRQVFTLAFALLCFYLLCLTRSKKERPSC